MDDETCFACGAPLLDGDKCSVCGYEFTLLMKCPRLVNDGMICIHTRKVCKEKCYEECKILRAND